MLAHGQQKIAAAPPQLRRTKRAIARVIRAKSWAEETYWNVVQFRLNGQTGLFEEPHHISPLSCNQITSNFRRPWLSSTLSRFASQRPKPCGIEQLGHVLPRTTRLAEPVATLGATGNTGCTGRGLPKGWKVRGLSGATMAAETGAVNFR